MTLSTSNLTNAGAPAITPPSAHPSPPVASLSAVNLPAGNTRAEGDRVLARNLYDASKSGFRFDQNVTVPPHSTMGQWQAQLNSALKNPDFRSWLATQGIHPQSITIYPDKGELRANNDQKVFTLDDLSGWRDVAGPILAAGKIFAGGHNMSVQGDTIEDDQVPYWKVANFYGQDTDQTGMAELESTYTFAPLPQSVAASRSEEALQKQREVVGNINDLSILKRKIYNKLAGMRLAGFNVDPHSSHQPKGFTSAEDFIKSKGWNLPATDLAFGHLLYLLQTEMTSIASSGLTDPPASNREVSGPASRAQVDATLLQAANGQQTDTLIEVPPLSTLGQWATQLRYTLLSPAFQEGIRKAGFDPSSIEFHSADSSITGNVNGQRVKVTVEGQTFEHPEIFNHAIAEAVVIGSGVPTTLSYSDILSGRLKSSTVKTFYDESFKSVLKSEKARGQVTLAIHHRITADVYDRRNLAEALRSVGDRLAQGLVTEQTLPQQLNNRLELQPGSTYAQLHQTATGATASIASLLETLGKPLPSNKRQIDDLVTLLNGNSELFTEETLLAMSYSQALRQSAAGEGDQQVSVPRHSLLGRWMLEFQRQFQNEIVQQWMTQQNIEPNTLNVVPSTGQATGMVNGSPKTFTLTDDSDWSQIAEPILAAGKIIAPRADQSLRQQPLNLAISVPQNIVAGFYNEPPSTTSTAAEERANYLTSRGAFDDLRSANEQSLPALESQRQKADAHYSKLGRSLADKAQYKTLAEATSRALPSVRADAKQWAEALILKLTGKQVDADTIYLNRFGMARNIKEIENGRIISSQRLPDALLSNFSEHDRVPGNLDAYSGLYTAPDSPKELNKFPLAPSVLMHESDKTDFQQQATARQESFWETHGDDYRALVKGRFIAQARQQLRDYEAKTPAEQAKMAPEHRFTREDYKVVMGAASNVPIDENTPVTLAQLQTSAPAKGVVRAHALDINGYASSDIVRFTAMDDGLYLNLNGRRDGRQVLYVPGATVPFICFDSLTEMDQWIVDQAKDPEKRKALASHFSLYNRQDGVSYYGVDTSLEKLSTGGWDNLEGSTIDRGNFSIHGDVFKHIKTETEKRMKDDADTMIKSNSEVSRDTWLNDVSVAAGLLGKLAPLGAPVGAVAIATGITQTALGVETSVSGDTLAERRGGAWKAFDGTLNSLFSLGASGTVEDPFTPPRAPLPARIPLNREVFADGTTAWVTEHPLTENAYAIPRKNGFDWVDGEKVYRYDPKNPGRLTDLGSAEYTQELEDYEAICPLPSEPAGRAKRFGNNDECFSRIIVATGDADQTALQAIEHERLYPSPRKLFNSDRFVLRERRLHKLVDTELGTKLAPMPPGEPIEYKTFINGKIVNDQKFGLPDGVTNDFVEANTRVVKLDSISKNCNDKREMRGIIVDSPLPGDTAKYLVVEADTAEFYYVRLKTPPATDVTFSKCSPTLFDMELAKRYRSTFYKLQGDSPRPIDANFIALPKLQDAFKALEKNGYTSGDIARLKAKTNTMNPGQQREVVFQLVTRGALGNVNYSMIPNRISPLTKPSNFASLSVAQKNRFYALKAKDSVDRALKATGLGPGNLVRSVSDLQRANASYEVLDWLRKTANQKIRDLGAQALKSGAGNCGEMSLLARDIINESGGRAYTWEAGKDHMFTVVGGPSILPEGTVDFSQAQWADAWIVDPWAEIACPARQYMAELEVTMKRWDALGWKLRHGTNPNMSPLDTDWTNTLFNLPKTPDGPGYSPQGVSA